MPNLAEKKCVPCEGGVKPFTETQIKEYLSQLNPSTHSASSGQASPGQEWEVLDDPSTELRASKIKKRFKFKDFKEAIAFVNKIAELAEEEGHHPDIRIFGYKNVEIELSTHAIGGLSENDFILAAKIEQLV